MAHEINLERLGESSSKKKHNNALKATENTSEGESERESSEENSEDEDAFLSRRLQQILTKKKYQLGRRYFKNGKDFKRPEGKKVKRSEPICYECKKLGHLKVEFKKKDNVKRFKKNKKKAMAIAWNNESDLDSESSSNEEEEKANLAFMANVDDKSKCVDIQADCVDTTGCCFRTDFWDSELVSTHRWKRYGYKAHQLADHAGLGLALGSIPTWVLPCSLNHEAFILKLTTRIPTPSIQVAHFRTQTYMTAIHLRCCSPGQP
ncbi:hypothetical protein Taro_006918 [Colocasia esculenta]|uniref:Uncharacterized protein n=1 Tax=Colocasia esculenta TaxID=4460 RepID=A0A843TTS0_COLES|nr:hypothetical protein [Colocasia esculenta]